MNSFLNLRLRGKLIVLFGVILLLFIGALWNAYATMMGLIQAQMDVQNQQADATALAEMESNRNESRVAMLMLLQSQETDTQARQGYAVRIRQLASENADIRRQLFDRNRVESWMSNRLQQYQSVQEVYSRTRETVLGHALAGRLDEARRISLGENQQRFNTLEQMGSEMRERAVQQAQQSIERSQETAAQARGLYLLIGAAVVLVGFVAVWTLGRTISGPLAEVVAAAERIATGDLRVSLTGGDREDEVGTLSRAFQRMTDNLRTIQRDLQDGVNVLASSASEIFTATAQIAAGATETATAVSQTTATAEEVKQTAQVSAQKAGNVADIAQRAAQSAQTGRKAIEESIAGMQHIREQMQLIAETVVRLSEQSQAIGEIIASVNDLAEQSNLLAVNASIEAAKAGEHGKGFAVVAQEIRNLATQSKESTAQVRTILNDIQRATTATVMAAEQGSKAVDTGVKQVNQSGEAIRMLAESIVSAAQAATQITASAQEQLIGIDQVTIAIQNILQSSKQNATATQQAEAGAKSLSQLGQNLKTVVQKLTV